MLAEIGNFAAYIGDAVDVIEAILFFAVVGVLWLSTQGHG